MPKLACFLNYHGSLPTVLDTLESIQEHMTNDILVLCDGASDVAEIPMPVPKVIGLRHGDNRAPYKNITLGLKLVSEHYPNADWYCYIEYDNLVTSDKFKTDLDSLPSDVWLAANDIRTHEDLELPLIEKLLKDKLPPAQCMLGCCVFYRREFIAKLHETDFFNKFLYLTNPFHGGFFPGYMEQEGAYDLAEHLFPTLCAYYGGRSHQLARWLDYMSSWMGDFQTYLMRFRPEISLKDPYLRASIIHPLKEFDHPIRNFFRTKRQRRKSHVTNSNRQAEVGLYGPQSQALHDS